MWKNLTIGLLSVIFLLSFTEMLPHTLSPVVALVTAGALYVYIFNTRRDNAPSCMLVPFAILYGCLIYAFVAIIINILYAWGAKDIPGEFIFFDGAYLPSLILNPICTVIFGYFLLRREHLRVCRTCQIVTSDGENNSMRSIQKTEAKVQLRNLFFVFLLLSVVLWAYYLFFYVNINLNSRDKYIFIWMTIIVFVLDGLYFIMRYYNLYLDLKEGDEIITQDELADMTAKTYLRFYVVCGNNVYVDTHAIDPKMPYKEVIDTPFFTKRNVNGIPVSEVKRIIENMVGYVGGELRFFFGRRLANAPNHSLLRYFYFLDGKPEDYPEVKVDGEWMDYERIKYIYSTNPGKLAEISVGDTTRLATIMLTAKTFDENGYRRSKIKMYTPSFNMVEVRQSNLDFQDDKWIHVSMFNSDTPFYGFKKWWRGLINGRARRNNGSWR